MSETTPTNRSDLKIDGKRVLERSLKRGVKDVHLEWLASVLFLAAVVSPLAYSYVANRFGRRPASILISMVYAITWPMILFGKNVAFLLTARVFSGIAAGGTFVVTPMYVMEISENRIRGTAGSLIFIMQALGFLTVNILAIFLNYYTVIYVVMGIPFLHIFIAFFMPESPNYLVKIGRYEDAAKNIARLRGLKIGDDIVKNEVKKLQHQYRSSSDTITIRTILKNKAWKRALYISMSLHTVRNMGGGLVIITYSRTILEKSAIFNVEETISLPAAMFAGAFVSLVMVDMCGRKSLLIFGCFLLGASYTVLGVIMHMEVVSEGLSWLPIFLLAVALFGYGIGVLSVPYIIVAELFNVQVKALIVGYIAVYGWAISFINVHTFEYIHRSIGIHSACYIYAGIDFFGAILFAVYVPETKGKTVIEIEDILMKRQTAEDITRM